MLRSLWLAVFICLLSAPYAAAERMAIFIGVGAYENALNLPNAVRDAKDLSDRFQALGYSTHLLENPSQRAFYRFLLEVREEIQKAKQVILYFAGHGLHIHGQTYLLPTDVGVDPTAWVPKSIALNILINILTKSPKQVILFIDACQENPFAQDAAIDPNPYRWPAGIYVAYAAQFGAPAYDGSQKNGPFASAILAYMKRPGVDVIELMRKVRLKVLLDTKGLQIPWSQSSLLRPALIGSGA